MKHRLIAAALALAATSAANAADLYRDPPDRYGSAYDDPRYADLYGRAPPPRALPPTYEPPYRYGYNAPPIPREPVYRHDDRPRYAETHPDRPRMYSARPGCVPKEEVRHALQRDGWSDFHDAQVIDRDTATVRARRPGGRLFELNIDRCTGEIVASRPLDHRFAPRADYDYGPSYGEGYGRRSYRY
jgi:hypothetical protein